VKGILPRQGGKFSALQHNCSGKHAGFLASCVYHGWDVRDYLNPRHPLHRKILQYISDLCEYPARKIEIGIDGCSAPNFALPLKNMALGFAKLASAKSDGSLGLVLKSMRQYPEMVSGQGRLDYALSRINSGKIVAKAGAEALECLGIVGENLGMAVRIYDGNNRATGPVVIEALRQLGFIKEDELDELEKFARPQIKNFAGKIVGHIQPAFKLKAVQ
jgi:L-asparaginase II